METSYIAGIFDGEGWITVSCWKNSKKKMAQWSNHYVRYQLVVGIANTYFPLIHQINEQLGGDLFINDSAHRRDPKNRVVYTWRLSSQKAANFLAIVMPYLIVKKDEAVLAIKLQENIQEHKGTMRYHPDRATEIHSFRQGLTDEIRALKKRRFDILPSVGSDPNSH